MATFTPRLTRSEIVRSARMLAGGVLLLTAAFIAAAVIALPLGVSATAHADACPDVEVIFARGTFEPPGVGVTGQAFADALRSHLKPMTVLDVDAVDYPASLDFVNGAGQGVADASNMVLDVAARCPNTTIVTGGYSQGAAVAAYMTADDVPVNFPLPEGITGPLPPAIARHVAAVVLFGKPSAGFLNFLVRDAPPITIGHLYTAKTIELCVPEDPVCSPTGNEQSAHGTYATNGMADQAAEFATRAVSAAA